MSTPRVPRLAAAALAAACALSSSCSLTGDDGDCAGGKCDELGDCAAPGVALAPSFPGTTLRYPVGARQSPDPADPAFYVVEKGGRILAVEPGKTGERFDPSKPAKQVRTFLDLETSCKEPVEGTCAYRQANGEPGWEEGMLDVAFHPRFPEQPFVYVSYVAGRGNVMVWRLSRFAVAGGAADRDSELVMLAERKPEDTHNGGSLAFGPDGRLYVSVGDGGGVLSEEPQNTNTIFGSVLRLDVDLDCGRGYGIPDDNPFAAGDLGNRGCNLSGEGGRPEIYAWGIRNPWRMSFDRETGELWEAEVGQDSREEVNLVEKGKNYGYPMLEANLTTPKNVPGVCKAGCDRLQAPEIEIFHEGQAGTPPGAPVGNSVTGGYVYRPSAAVPGASRLGLEGRYLYGDFMTTEIFAYEKGAGKPPALVARTGKRIAAFVEDRDGNLYVLDHQAAGGMYQLIPGACLVANRPENFYAFLSRDAINSEQDALGYYAANGIDPIGYTLKEFQAEFMGVEVERCFGDAQPAGCANIVKAYYQNAMDLGFWREMYCTTTLDRGRGGCMVRNWKEEQDLAFAGGELLENLGTVAMNVSPEGFTRFYAFGPDGVISPVAVLDSEGPKAVPGLCTPCHGGTRWVNSPGQSPDIGSIFREFEPSLFGRREGTTGQFPGIDQAGYDRELFALNRSILSANRALRTEEEGSPPDFDKWKQSIIEYVTDDLYEVDDPQGPVSRQASDPAHIPPSWAEGGTEAQIEAKEQLWMNVVAPYCMGCHRTNTKDFAEYSNFAGLAAIQGQDSLLESYTSGDPADDARALSFMPQAELMFDNMAASKAGSLEVDVPTSIRVWLQQVVNPSGPVCDVSFTVRAPTRPGQDVFVVGEIGTLGEWEPQNGLPLAFDRCVDAACNLSEWKGSVGLLRGTAVEFKATMLRFNDGGPPTVTWEDGANRRLEVPADDGAVCDLPVNLTFDIR